MRELLHETEAETLVFVLHDSLGMKLYFACDIANKRGACNMIKHVSFYDIAKDKLITCELDSNACIGTNQKMQKLLTQK